MFAEAALRCWHAAALLLGWRPDEFWTSTPAELAASLGQAGEGQVEPVSQDMVAKLRERFPD